MHELTELGYVLKFYVKEKRKCRFENTLEKKSKKVKAQLEINVLVEGLLYITNLIECSLSWNLSSIVSRSIINNI